jgi:hypothetical protein
MKILKLLPFVLLFIATSCVSVRVTSDYNEKANFNDYKTFAFYKKGIDKVEISDLDKRRILKAIESDLLAKGFTKSNNPDVLVNIFTKSREKINVYNNNRYFGWYPWYYGGFGPYGYGFGFDAYNNVSRSTEGTLFIDLIDAEKKELAWQGMGTGALLTSKDVAKKEARINEFVTEIMAKYPPGTE